MKRIYNLVYNFKEKKLFLGTLSFNGKYIFKLNQAIDVDVWNKIGIIPVSPETRRLESDRLFPYINSRLPIQLREAEMSEKIKYIDESGLRVPSDYFYFEKVVTSGQIKITKRKAVQ